MVATLEWPVAEMVIRRSGSAARLLHRSNVTGVGDDVVVPIGRNCTTATLPVNVIVPSSASATRVISPASGVALPFVSTYTVHPPCHAVVPLLD